MIVLLAFEFSQIKLLVSPLRPQAMPVWLNEELYDMSSSIIGMAQNEFDEFPAQKNIQRIGIKY